MPVFGSTIFCLMRRRVPGLNGRRLIQRRADGERRAIMLRSGLSSMTSRYARCVRQGRQTSQHRAYCAPYDDYSQARRQPTRQDRARQGRVWRRPLPHALTLAWCVSLPARVADSPSCLHEIGYQSSAGIFVKCRIGKAPQAPAHDKIAAVGCRGVGSGIVGHPGFAAPCAHAIMAWSGIAPDCRAISRPPLNRIIVGMDRMA